MTELTKAAADVLAERQRQIEREGWTPELDDRQADGELALAAACYAKMGYGLPASHVSDEWPFSPEWLKQSRSPRRDLVKAAALLLAEIERLDRVQANAPANVVPFRQGDKY